MFPLKNSCGVKNDSPVTLTEGDDSIKALSERKSMEACKSHKEAERRRRQLINAHLSTLRSLLPNTAKSGKASLLAEVVHRVRELMRQVEDVGRRDCNCCCNDSQPEVDTTWPFPGDCGEAALNFSDEEEKLLKVTVCCEDRPGLNHDLSRVIRTVQAEMTTVGGRTKSVVAMQWSGDEEQIGLLKRALKDVVENWVSRLAQETGLKRARTFGWDSELVMVFGRLSEAVFGFVGNK
ncbi:transcription factor AIG1-like [Hibiscus syriacus]|uniref:transcription factor AIG1-like n=1 Tax=Hibiscus syriacus TaxID=106335 RepID=UPI0019217385|nr:transcription factor AIG1-like [Hibiscus syriacus]